MRYPLFALVIATMAAPALAQSGADMDRRLDRLERELRAVQRQVFPSGAGATPLAPEINPQQAPITPSGVPATSAMADQAARLDALESQLRSLTGQAEENMHRLSQIERALTDFRTATEGRLAAIEKPEPVVPELGSTEVTPPASAVRGAATGTTPPTSSAGDPAEEAYLTGFRQWESKRYTEAQATLEAMVKKYPKHPRSSFAQNLLGRAYLDAGKPATAAKVLLSNYESNRNGERAPDSLFYLGKALVELDQPANACKVYDELEAVYGEKLRAALKQELPRARAAAKCR